VKPTLAELASALIAPFEGPPRLTAYQDAGGVWTIGRGHTRGVVKGMVITPAQSDLYFAEDAAPLLTVVERLPLIVAACYVDFGYNVGEGALARVLNGQDSLDNPIHTTDRHGIVEPGLVSRRRLEALLIAAASTP